MTGKIRVWKRETADGRAVYGWSDGDVTWAFGYAIRGVGVARESWAVDADLRASWALAGEVCLLDAKEVGRALMALRRVARQPYNAGCGWRFSDTGWRASDVRSVICRALNAGAPRTEPA